LYIYIDEPFIQGRVLDRKCIESGTGTLKKEEWKTKQRKTREYSARVEITRVENVGDR